jgi:ABC-type polysaccharide/polyol phosphate export permease
MSETIALPIYDSEHRESRSIEELKALWKYRGLVVELVIRDIKVRYKRSVLGVVWTMLVPLLNMVALTAVFSALLKTQIQNYPVYFMTGSLFWGFFAQSTSSAASQTHDSNEMAKRIYIPRSVFVIASIGVGLVNLVLSIVPLILILLVTRFPLHATWFFLPISVFIAAFFAAGIGFILFTIASRFSDVREMYIVLIQTWFFLTPIVYHPSIVPPRFRIALWANPLYYLLQTFRRPIYDGVIPDFQFIAASAGLALGTLVVGWVYFCNRSDRFAYQT